MSWAFASCVGLTCAGTMLAAAPAAPSPLPADAPADYQLGGDYEPPPAVSVVTRDWFTGSPLEGGYSICYVNAFQTQADDPDVDRPDETSNWPSASVLHRLGDDPNWPGEYLVDIGTPVGRSAAAEHVRPMIETCARKGFVAVEFDNLDSWTRFDGTDRAGEVPFDEDDAVAYAARLTASAHGLGLAVAQKNTPQFAASTSLDVIGFDFAVVEECGRYDECDAYTGVFGDRMIVVEYTDEGFAAACDAVGPMVSVVLRDVGLTTPDSIRYRYGEC